MAASISVCGIPPECSQALGAAASFLGGMSTVCQMSVEQLAVLIAGAGCAKAFTPPALPNASMASLCPVTCADAGVVVPGCTFSPPPLTPPGTPPVLPAPPPPPAPPPHTPSSVGFTVVTMIDELRAALAATLAGGSLALFLPEGCVLVLGGAAIVVDAIDLHLTSEGSGATLDARHASQVFDVKNDAALRLHTVTLANGQAASGGGAVHISFGRVTMTACTMVNSRAGFFGGAMQVNNGNVTLADTTIANSVAFQGGALATGRCTIALIRCAIINSTAGDSGGAMIVMGGTVLTIANGTTITNSTATIHGGVMYIYEAGEGGSNVTVSSSTFAHSTARDGGIVHLNDESPKCVLAIFNSRIIDSRAQNDGG
eukprot:995705-Prymnesium_polylepis.1